MKHITILIPEGRINLSSIIGPYIIFSVANKYLVNRGQKPFFKIELAGHSQRVNLYDGLFSIQPNLHFDKVKKTDLIIIPAAELGQANSVFIKKNKIFVTWILKHYKRGAEVASICSGAFLLASTGLVDGKQCSTHWLLAEDFKQQFPNVKLVTDRLITDEHGIYTNGGAYSFLNFMIYLVEKKFDRQTAIYCSKIFQIEMDRQSQAGFIIFNGQKHHGDDMVQEAQTYIEHNLHEKISME